MKKTRLSLKKEIIFVKVFGITAILLLPLILMSTTYHSGIITVSETWTELGSPHFITGDIDVRNGAVLTIESGSTIKFFDNYRLLINGTLNAEGDPGNRIVFTSNQGVPDNGDWGNIYFNAADGVNTLSYCDIMYGGSSLGNIVVDGSSDVTILNCNITNSATCGIFMYNGSSPNIVNCTIQSNDTYGIFSNGTNCLADISMCNILNNGGPAVRLSIGAVGLMNGTTLSSNSPDEIQIIGGTITSSALWNHGNPYKILGNININNYITLTLSPGSVMKFDGDYYLKVYGTLNANGTLEDRITFSSYQTSPANGDWRYIYFYHADGANILNYCDIYYGGSNNGNIFMEGSANVTISNCNIKYSATNGIHMYATSPDIFNCSFSNNSSHGIYTNNDSNPLITNCTLSTNDGHGIYANTATSDFDLTGGNITNNGGAAVRLSANAVDLMDNVTISGNNPDEIQVLGENLTSDAQWNHNLPYRVIGNVTINNGVTLTLDPGTLWRFDGIYYLSVLGTINANGTAEDHITITSYDSSPENGDWKYIYFYDPDGINTLNYCDISYGGNSYGNIYMEGSGDVTFSNCEISNSGASGIHLWSASANITNCSIESNLNYGIYSSNTSSLVNISGGNITNNVGPAARISIPAVNLMDGMTMSGNNPDEIQVMAGSISGSVVWDDPYPYKVLGNVTVNNGSTLTLNPGTIWKFDGNYSLTVLGTLNADGTSDDHITFTSYESLPSNGDWMYIYFYYPDGVNILDYCDISYGGSSYGIIFMEETADVTFSNCNIMYSGTTGFYLYKVSPDITNCLISENNSNGIYNSNNCFSQLINNQIINNLGNGILNAANGNPSLGTNTTQWNDIYGNSLYSFYNNSTQAIDAQYVYWGTDIESEIQTAIYDDTDDSALGIVTYSPWMSGPQGVAAPESPENVIININGTQVEISWDAVSGATSYKIYSSNYPYAGYTEDTSGTFVGESWSVPTSETKKFYYVKAVN